jgi:4-methylaminobutanoate oxidase (formaldehyde-forming)
MDKDFNTVGLPESGTEFETIIIGGGIAGCSVAYHLAEGGKGDGVLLLEQKEIAGGTTWHAAGLVGRLRTSNSMTRVNDYSASLYSRLKDITGVDVGWKQVGSLIVASSADRMTQLHRTTAMAEQFGVECRILSREETGEKWPLIRTDDLLGGAWLPGDGRVIPRRVAEALAKGALDNGATLVEHCEVESLIVEKGRVVGVHSNGWSVYCRNLVIATGMWGRQLGQKAGINIPLYPVEHHYAVSNPIAEVDDSWPVARDPDRSIYFRPEEGSIMLGAFQKYTKPWMVDVIPPDFSFKLLEDDWEKFSDPLDAGNWRIPSLQKAGYMKFVNGPESFTPDNNFLLGETAEVQGVYICAGFNSAGIASAGGAGMLLAQWIRDGEQPIDLASVDIRRFHPSENNRHFLRQRVTETLGLHYQMAWPNREFESGRPLRKTALYHRHDQHRAVFGSKSGWERPNWYAFDGQSRTMEYSFGRQNWFENHRSEHMAVRENIGLLDQSTLSKILVSGPDAAAFLSRLCANNIEVAPGVSVYTPMLSRRATFESDVTVLRLDEQEFHVLTSTSQLVRDLDRMRRHADRFRVCIEDITTRTAVVSIMGPQSRDFLQPLVDCGLDNDAFPFGSFKRCEVGPVNALALRRTYVGELGWEFHVAWDQAEALFDFLMERGRNRDLKLCGNYAINSLRVEKGYRAWGHEISLDEDPVMAGMKFAVDISGSRDFIGAAAYRKLVQERARKRLLQIRVRNPDVMLWGNEPVFMNGERSGYTTSAAYGHSIGSSVAMAYFRFADGFRAPVLEGCEASVLINGTMEAVDVSVRPFYDPDRKKITG